MSTITYETLAAKFAAYVAAQPAGQDGQKFLFCYPEGAVRAAVLGGPQQIVDAAADGVDDAYTDNPDPCTWEFHYQDFLSSLSDEEREAIDEDDMEDRLFLLAEASLRTPTLTDLSFWLDGVRGLSGEYTLAGLSPEVSGDIYWLIRELLADASSVCGDIPADDFFGEMAWRDSSEYGVHAVSSAGVQIDIYPDDTVYLTIEDSCREEKAIPMVATIPGGFALALHASAGQDGR